MIWLSEVDDQHLTLVGKDLVEIGQLTKMQVDVANGFIVSSAVYREFVDRNRISDVIIDVVESLEATYASKTITNHFLKSKYSKEEINYLRDYYKKLSKPVSIWAQMIDASTGEPLEQILPISISDIHNFETFSDSIIKSWQSLWGHEQIDQVKRGPFGLSSLSIVLMVQEQGKDEALARPESLMYHLKLPMEKESYESKPTYKSFLTSLAELFK